MVYMGRTLWWMVLRLVYQSPVATFLKDWRPDRTDNVATGLRLPVLPNLGQSGCQLPLLTWKSETGG